MTASSEVLVVDDHPLAREGLILAVRYAVPGAAIRTAGSISEAEDLIGKREVFRLVMLDLAMPDARGFSGLLRLQFRMPGVPILIITASDDLRLAGIARDLGAAGFVSKCTPLDTIADVIGRTVQGERTFPDVPAPPGAASLKHRLETLSDAQRRVVFALADGRANKQIAHDLSVTEATVKAHLTAIFRQLGVTNRTQALLALQPLLSGAAP